MRISASATLTIIDGEPHYMALTPLVSNVTTEDFSNSETKFNIKCNINSASSSMGNTCTIALKPFKGNSLEALLIQITKAKLVVKGVLMRSKEELKVLGSEIFKGFYEQNFYGCGCLSDNPDTDLNQV